MKIVIQPDADSATELVASIIAGELRAKAGLVLGLATGSTMEAVYEKLARLHAEDGLDFSSGVTFNLDEYVGLPSAHPNSYRHYMNRHFFSQVNINPANTHLPDGMAADLRAECDKYERLITGSGGIDLQLLGIGLNGHLGFNEPPAELHSRTHVEALSPVTRAHNAPLFSSPQEVPTHAITMGLGTILDSRRCLLLATGEGKAEIVARALEGPLTGLVPATALQLHPRCTVVLDASAGSRLKQPTGHRNGDCRPDLLESQSRASK